MANQGSAYPRGVATDALPVAAATALQVISRSGYLGTVVVTTTGTTALFIFDNALGVAGGTVIGVVPASAAVGPYNFFMPAKVGIYVAGVVGTPAVTVSYS